MLEVSVRDFSCPLQDPYSLLMLGFPKGTALGELLENLLAHTKIMFSNTALLVIKLTFLSASD